LSSVYTSIIALSNSDNMCYLCNSVFSLLSDMKSSESIFISIYQRLSIVGHHPFEDARLA
jgi:hypothetical protein